MELYEALQILRSPTVPYGAHGTEVYTKAYGAFGAL